MYILFFGLWIIFNARITLEIIIFGLVIAAVMYGFICKFMDYSIKKDLFIARKMGLIIQYIAILSWEIVKANIATIRMILSSKYIIEPTVVYFKTNLKTRFAKVMLANSITLTPGTITVSLEDDELMVHCLDKDFSEGLEDSIFVQLLEKIEDSGGLL
ncbi:MAG: Na+/H+ antiporter subunit E [Eubacteriales bacterium]